MAFGGWGGGGGGGLGGGGGGFGGGGLRRAVDGWADEGLGKAYDHKVVVRLAKYAAPYKKRLLIGILGTIIFSAASYTQPLLVGMAVNSAMSANLHDLTLQSLLLVGTALVAWGSYFG
ncbi:MAG: hypothetical protein Q7K41_05310, partial [Dehalococcoidales bacterium]|nr:hypothetical protein [Dehalococcoidales bacterium]